MKYLKKFENFDLGRFGQEQEEEENIARLNSEEEESDIMLKIEFDLILKKYFENSS